MSTQLETCACDESFALKVLIPEKSSSVISRDYWQAVMNI